MKHDSRTYSKMVVTESNIGPVVHAYAQGWEKVITPFSQRDLEEHIRRGEKRGFDRDMSKIALEGLIELKAAVKAERRAGMGLSGISGPEFAPA